MSAAPCKGREHGCLGETEGGRARCRVCADVHAAREAERRRARRAASACWVCGQDVAIDPEGYQLTTCSAHARYFATRGRKARKTPAAR